MGRFLTVSILLLTVSLALRAEEYEYDANVLCGKYSATAGGAIIEIVPASQVTQPLPTDLKMKYTLANRYLIILEDNPSPTLEPGTIMGWVSPLAKPGLYDGMIFTKEKNGKLTSPRKFLLEMNVDGTHLSMLEIKNRVRIDPLRFLPYIFHGISLKGTLKMEDNRRHDVEGFLKFYPRPLNPYMPRQL